MVNRKPGMVPLVSIPRALPELEAGILQLAVAEVLQRGMPRDCKQSGHIGIAPSHGPSDEHCCLGCRLCSPEQTCTHTHDMLTLLECCLK